MLNNSFLKMQQCLDSCTRYIFALYQLSLKLGSGILTFGRRLATPFLFLCVRSQQQLHCKPNMEISFAKNDWMMVWWGIFYLAEAVEQKLDHQIKTPISPSPPILVLPTLHGLIAR